MKNKILHILLFSLILFSLNACKEKEILERLDKVENQLTDAQASIKELKEAYADGKIIKTVTPLDENKGWVIIFSDNSKIELFNGEKGKDGVDGKDGKDANPSQVISKMEQDETTHVITMTLEDGTVLKFNTFIVYPTGISILSTEAIQLSFGTQTSIEFRINPSNANIYMGKTIEECPIELDKVGVASLKSSYVTKPTNYRLVSVEQVFNTDTQELMQGQYRAVIEDTKNTFEYEEMAALVLNYFDGNNEKVQLSSAAFKIIGDNPVYMKTGLPVCYLNTPNAEPITSKENWIKDATLTIVNPDGSVDYKGTLSIRGRGNTTWGYPKKPYNIKLDKSSNILGMASAKKWALLANWMDRTLMRNAVAFEISRKSGLAWTPDGRYVELVLNGTHIGNYYLCEKIEVGKNRVNIKELDSGETDPEKITGGYLFELDTYFDEPFKFKSSIKQLPYMFSDPDEINGTQEDYVKSFVSDMELVLCGMNKSGAISDFINIESFVDWWFVTELTMNNECNWPKSCYMHKDRGGRMTAGPVWDFDWATFIPSKVNQFSAKSSLYYPELFNNQVFVSLVKSRWPSFKSSVTNDIPTFIESLKEQLKLSDALNITMWPIGGEKPNGDEDMTFDEAVDRLKSSLLQKIDWLDTQINAL